MSDDNNGGQLALSEIFSDIVRTDNAEKILQIGLDEWVSLWLGSEELEGCAASAAELKQEGLAMVREHAAYLAELVARVDVEDAEDWIADLAAANEVLK